MYWLEGSLNPATPNGLVLPAQSLYLSQFLTPANLDEINALYSK